MAEYSEDRNARLLGKLLLAGAAVWFLVLRGVNACKIVFQGIRILSITPTEIKLGITMLIRNPLIVDIVVNNIVGDVYLMNTKCATVDYPVNTRLYGIATNTFNLNFIVNSSQLTEAIWANIQTGDINTLICRFVGYVQFGKVKIPVDRQFTFNELMSK